MCNLQKVVTFCDTLARVNPKYSSKLHGLCLLQINWNNFLELIERAGLELWQKMYFYLNLHNLNENYINLTWWLL